GGSRAPRRRPHGHERPCRSCAARRCGDRERRGSAVAARHLLLGLGEIPDRLEVARLVEKALRGRLLVDMPDEIAIGAEAAKLLQARLEAADDFERDAELLVFLLADIARAIIHCDADAARAGLVRATAMPEASMPDENRAFR